MKLRNILIVVKDIERARKYYHDLFGLDMLLLCYSNGMVFRDDAGAFTKIRESLLEYYPTKVWMMRLAEKLHGFAQTAQTNYARNPYVRRSSFSSMFSIPRTCPSIRFSRFIRSFFSFSCRSLCFPEQQGQFFSSLFSSINQIPPIGI